MKTVSYAGNRTGDYDHETGKGLVGKVLGPGYDGLQYLVADAVYDPETDRTRATLQPMRDPYGFLRRAISEAGR